MYLNVKPGLAINTKIYKTRLVTNAVCQKAMLIEITNKTMENAIVK